jgi:hypothetical protein
MTADAHRRELEPVEKYSACEDPVRGPADIRARGIGPSSKSSPSRVQIWQFLAIGL